jgi:hypothetical protein
MKTPSNRFLLLCLLAVISLLAACGGGGDAGDDTTTVTDAAEVDTTTTAGASATTVEDTGDTTDDGGGLSLNCIDATEAMAAAVNSYSTGLAGAFGGTIDDDSLQVAADQLQAMADAAPDEIKDDLEVIAEELGAFYAALAEIGFDGTGTPTQEQMDELAGLAESLNQEAFQEASDNIEAWFESNCE